MHGSQLHCFVVCEHSGWSLLDQLTLDLPDLHMFVAIECGICHIQSVKIRIDLGSNDQLTWTLESNTVALYSGTERQ